MIFMRRKRDAETKLFYCGEMFLETKRSLFFKRLCLFLHICCTSKPPRKAVRFPSYLQMWVKFIYFHLSFRISNNGPVVSFYSAACHRNEPDRSQCDRGPAGDFAVRAFSWKSAAREAVAAQLRPGEQAPFLDDLYLSWFLLGPWGDQLWFNWTFLNKYYSWPQTSI